MKRVNLLLTFVLTFFIFTNCSSERKNESKEVNQEVSVNQPLKNQDFKPDFIIMDSAYTIISQEIISQELENIESSNIVNNNMPYFLEELKRKLSTAGTKCYSYGNDLTENIIIENAPAFVDDEIFKQVVNNMEEYINQYLAEGIEMKLIKSGTDKYKDLYDYKFMIIYNSLMERYTYQYYFNFSQKTYSISINSNHDNINIEKLIGIEEKSY